MPTKPRRVAIGIETVWPYKHHTGVVAGVLAYCEEHGLECEQAPYLETTGLAGFRGRAIDGLVARVTPALARSLQGGRLPVVNVWANSPVRDLPGVLPDHEAVGRMAARHLLDRGHRRLGFLGVRGSDVARRELAGFRAEAAAGGARVEILYVPWTDFPDRPTWLRFLESLDAWIRSWKTPVGILAMIDPIARHLADACRAAGLRIPADAAIVGVGNTELLCERWAPSLSSIEMGFERVGYEAARLLDRLMAGRAAPSRPVRVPPVRVVVRLSTNAFAVEDPLVSRALRLIAARTRQPPRVRDVAAALFVTRRSLERRFRRVLRRSILDEILRARLERVERLLVETDRPLKAIAEETGFRRPERLNEAFRRERGVSPGAFRRDRRRS
jgi:LacI family transcriptional regulator